MRKYYRGYTLDIHRDFINIYAGLWDRGDYICAVPNEAEAHDLIDTWLNAV